MAQIQKVDEITEDAHTELRNLTEAYEHAETDYRAAVILEDAERAKIKEPDKAEIDFDRECRAFSLANTVAALESGKPLSGREGEVSAELEQRNGSPKRGIAFPWEALERRNDATIPTTDGSGGDLATRPTMKALERLFEQSAAARFGVKTMQVTGKPRFPELTQGASASWLGEGEGVDAASITTTAKEPAMKTLTARYLLSRQAIRENSALEPLLRRDLSEVLREALDLAVFRGTGADNQPSGLNTLLTGDRVISAEASVVTYGKVVKWATDLMSDAKLNTIKGIKVAGVPFMLGDLLAATYGDVFSQFEALQKVMPALTFSNQVAATAGSDPVTSTMYLGATDNHAFVPAWGSPELIVDPYSESKTGKVALTVFSFTDVLIQRLSTHFLKITNVAKGD